jgi:hypothetical protein
MFLKSHQFEHKLKNISMVFLRILPVIIEILVIIHIYSKFFFKLVLVHLWGKIKNIFNVLCELIPIKRALNVSSIKSVTSWYQRDITYTSYINGNWVIPNISKLCFRNHFLKSGYQNNINRVLVLETSVYNHIGYITKMVHMTHISFFFGKCME